MSRYRSNPTVETSSLPSRERGLKYFLRHCALEPKLVAPLAGARIEIVLACGSGGTLFVAPLAGARIEII